LDGKDMGKEFKFGVIKNKTEQVFGRVLDNFNDDIVDYGNNGST
jgi:hypothetical protein